MSPTPGFDEASPSATTSTPEGGLFYWRAIRLVLLLIGGVITLTALFYAVEDWRGAHALAKVRRAGEARGEQYNLAAVVPLPVPDDQNFAMAPLLKPMLDTVPGSRPVQWRDPAGRTRLEHVDALLRGREGDKDPTLAGCLSDRLTNLRDWQVFYRGNTNYPQPAQTRSAAEDVLTALTKFDPELKELSEAASRPFSRFPVQYDFEDPYSILLPHLARVKALANVLAIRAIARLDAGQSHEALADIKLGLRLGDSIKEEPIVISHLVRVAALSITLSSVREGLARQAWTETELAGLQRQLGAIDLLPEYHRVIRGERAMHLVGLDYYQRKGWEIDPFSAFGNQSSPWWVAAFRLMPNGWVRQNEALVCRLIEDYALPAVDEKAHRIHLERAAAVEPALAKVTTTPFNFLAKMLAGSLGRICDKTGRGQAMVDLARVACALERYRLAHGQFPDKLEALVPQSLDAVPADLFDGKPLRYQHHGASYVLYSVGSNQTDEGGKLVLTPNGTQPQWEQGDWVWTLPKPSE